MTKEQIKARELVIKYQFQNPPLMFDLAKSCALITVDEILYNMPFRDYGFHYDSISSRLNAVEEYWIKVKEEIENL